MRTEKLIQTFTNYKASLEDAHRIYADPNLSAVGKQTEYQKAQARAVVDHLHGPLAEAKTELEKAAANYAEARKWTVGELEDDPAELTLAWNTLQPLVMSGMSLEQVAYYATEPAQLAALHRFGPPLLTVELIRASDNHAVPLERVQESAAQLRLALEEAAARLGVADGTAQEARAALEDARAVKDALTHLAEGNGEVPMSVKAKIGAISTDAMAALLDIPGVNR